MSMLTIRFAGDEGAEGLRLKMAEGARLDGAIRAAGVEMAMPCGGRHTCGKCVVQVRGMGCATDEVERALLANLRKPAPREGYSWRMACLCCVEGDAEILLDDARKDLQVSAISAYRQPNSMSSAGKRGMAIDIGTTTVSVALFALDSGALLSEAHELNAQGKFGADVLSRIDHSNEHGILAQSECIREQLARMSQMVCESAGLDAPDQIVAAGNTTMLHYLAALDPRGIGISPFVPMSLFGNTFDINGRKMYLPHCVSAYVGADITCGMLVAGFYAADGPRMLVDVGTNGEMALFANGEMICCATAAGPAFEGAQIDMGMTATRGAIAKVRGDGGRIVCETIGDAPAVGICGTGLISAVYLMLQSGALDESGRIERDGHAYANCVFERADQRCFALGESGVYLSQRDIRNIQLAKAAIRAGIETLLHEAKLPAASLEALCIGGGFGSYIDPIEAAGIGLFPEESLGAFRALGNTSLIGAASILCEEGAKEKVAQFAAHMREISLATHPYFMDQYVEQMMFEEA